MSKVRMLEKRLCHDESGEPVPYCNALKEVRVATVEKTTNTNIEAHNWGRVQNTGPQKVMTSYTTTIDDASV